MGTNKNFRRCLALVLAIVMAFGMTAPGFAAYGGRGGNGGERQVAPAELFIQPPQVTSPAAVMFAPLTAETFDIGTGQPPFGTNWIFDGTELFVNAGANIEIEGSATNRSIIVTGDATITLSNASVTTYYEEMSPLIVENNVTLALNLDGTSTLAAGAYASGIDAWWPSSITINGQGTLNASGSWNGINADNLTIESGVVVDASGGTAIGAQTLVINGARVIATGGGGGDNGGAFINGIGATNITIRSGSYVRATAGTVTSDWAGRSTGIDVSVVTIYGGAEVYARGGAVNADRAASSFGIRTGFLTIEDGATVNANAGAVFFEYVDGISESRGIYVTGSAADTFTIQLGARVIATGHEYAIASLFMPNYNGSIILGSAYVDVPSTSVGWFEFVEPWVVQIGEAPNIRNARHVVIGPADRSISLTGGTMDFGAQTYGYTQPTAQSTIITNVGNIPTEGLRVRAPAGFQVSSTSAIDGFSAAGGNVTVPSIAIGGTDTFWTRPATGLGVGPHTGNVDVDLAPVASPPPPPLSPSQVSRAVSFTVTPAPRDIILNAGTGAHWGETAPAGWVRHAPDTGNITAIRFENPIAIGAAMPATFPIPTTAPANQTFSAWNPERPATMPSGTDAWSSTATWATITRDIILNAGTGAHWGETAPAGWVRHAPDTGNITAIRFENPIAIGAAMPATFPIPTTAPDNQIFSAWNPERPATMPSGTVAWSSTATWATTTRDIILNAGTGAHWGATAPAGWERHAPDTGNITAIRYANPIAIGADMPEFPTPTTAPADQTFSEWNPEHPATMPSGTGAWSSTATWTTITRDIILNAGTDANWGATAPAGWERYAPATGNITAIRYASPIAIGATMPTFPTPENAPTDQTFSEWNPARPATMPSGTDAWSSTATWTTTTRDIILNAGTGANWGANAPAGWERYAPDSGNITAIRLANPIAIGAPMPTFPTPENAPTDQTFSAWNPTRPDTMPSGTVAWSSTATWTTITRDIILNAGTDANWGATAPAGWERYEPATGNITAIRLANPIAIGAPMPTFPTPENAHTDQTFSEWNPERPATMPSGTGAWSSTAQWAMPGQFSVTFDLAGGNINGNTANIVRTVSYGENAVLPANPTRAGFNFAGWHPAGGYNNVTGDITITAQWTPVMPYIPTPQIPTVPYQPTPAVSPRIIYNPNGGAGSVIIDTVAHGSSHTVRPANTFTRENHTFAGWNTRPDGSGTIHEPESVIQNVTRDIRLYAQWTQLAPAHGRIAQIIITIAEESAEALIIAEEEQTKTISLPEWTNQETYWSVEAEGIVYLTIPHALLLSRENEDIVIVLTVYEPEDAANLFASMSLAITVGGVETGATAVPFTVAKSLSGFDLSGLNTYRIVARFRNTALIGGIFNSETGLMTFRAQAAGEISIVYAETLNRLTMGPDSHIILDLAGNAPTQLMDVLPIIQNGRTLIPIRFVAQALGAEVRWRYAAEYSPMLVFITIDGVTLTIPIGELTPELAALGMDVPAQLVDDRTMLPLRFVSEFFGAVVSWDGETRTIEIIRDSA